MNLHHTPKEIITALAKDGITSEDSYMKTNYRVLNPNKSLKEGGIIAGDTLTLQ